MYTGPDVSSEGLSINQPALHYHRVAPPSFLSERLLGPNSSPLTHFSCILALFGILPSECLWLEGGERRDIIIRLRLTSRAARDAKKKDLGGEAITPPPALPPSM